MDAKIFVHADWDDAPHLVGRLWALSRRNRQTATFEYAEDWLAHPRRFSLEPALKLGPGPFHAGSEQPLFGAFGDSAPDRWGRVLMRRAERRRAEKQGQAPRTLQEIDYLLLVNDESRQGALRFALNPGGPFLAESTSMPIPPMIDLYKLLSAADRVASDSESDEDLRLLLAPGSSLGGARPKASVRDSDGQLAIAKFPHASDEYSAVLWEALALSLAEKSGISTPVWRLERVGERPVLLSKRFDRKQATRIPFLSAMSMLGARDNETRSYLEIADAIRQYGAAPKQDMRELWKRMVFNILISNTDDHLRNHGFLYADSDGWRLAPAYDLNPVPTDIKPRVLSTAIDLDDTTASLEAAMRVANYFELDPATARCLASEVGAVVATWRAAASQLGALSGEISRMASAFEHADLKSALAL